MYLNHRRTYTKHIERTDAPKQNNVLLYFHFPLFLSIILKLLSKLFSVPFISSPPDNFMAISLLIKLRRSSARSVFMCIFTAEGLIKIIVNVKTPVSIWLISLIIKAAKLNICGSEIYKCFIKKSAVIKNTGRQKKQYPEKNILLIHTISAKWT